MPTLTSRQREILEFITQFQQESGTPPTLREIAKHFGFNSMNAAADHVRALRKKGLLAAETGQARSLRILSEWPQQPIAHIPIFGSIPAGLPADRKQEANGCVSIDIGTLGIKPTPRTFALEVRGDSMVGRHILDKDVVILEHGKTPKPNDVVAALIDNESTLKTFVMEKGKPWLKAENPKYPKMIPATELVIQGVMIALVRKGT